MRNSLATTALAAAILAMTLSAAGQSPRPATRSSKAVAPEPAVDEGRLLREMRALGMREMLMALGEENAKSKDPGKLATAVDVFLSEAVATADQDARDALLDRTIALEDAALQMAAANPGTTVRERIEALKMRLTRARTEGITKAEPYANRILYLWAGEQDRENVRKFTASARKALAPFAREMADAKILVGTDEEAVILGLTKGLDALSAEFRYREAWIILYECIATPAMEEKARKSALQQAATRVAEWISPSGRKKPPGGATVANSSVLLAGIAAREAGDVDRARNLMEQLLKTATAKPLHAQALFEIAHGKIAAGKDETSGLAAVKEFRDKAAESGVLMAVGIDLQSTLLTSYLYDLLAVGAAAEPAKAQEYAQKGAALLSGFLSKYPTYRRAFEDLVEAKYERMEINKVPEALRDLVIGARLRKGAPDALKTAMAEWGRVVEEAQKTPREKWDVEKVTQALFGLGTNHRKLNQMKESSECFRLLAEWFPEKEDAKAFSLLSVGILTALADENRATRADLNQYVRAMESLLAAKWGNDADCRVFHLDLGDQYEQAGQLAKAIEQFEMIRESDEEYPLAQSRALNIRGTMLVRSPEAPESKEKAPAVLEQVVKFRAFLQKYNPKDKNMLARARRAGAEADLMAIQIMLEILNQYDKAAEAAGRIPTDWPDAGNTLFGRARAALIDALLKQGKLEAALELVAKGDSLSTDVIQGIVELVRQRLVKMDPKTTDPAVRKKYVEDYKKFVDEICVRAEKEFKTQAATRPAKGAADWMAQQMYDFKQGVAAAYVESDEVKDLEKALEDYQALNKQRKTDAANVRGIARAQRKLGKQVEAMRAYNQLVVGLDLATNPKEYWEANLEMLQYVVEIRAKDFDEMDRVVLKLRQLADMDPALGGPVTGPKFEELREAAVAALKTAPKPVASKPAPASQPVKKP